MATSRDLLRALGRVENGGPPLDRLDGAHGVDQSRALEVPGTPDVGSGIHQRGTDPVGMADELGVHRKESGGNAGDVWSRHRGAGVLDVERARDGLLRSDAELAR